MPTSPKSSTPSAGCRIDWLPSRVQVAALVVLSLLAGGAVIASALPARPRPVLAGLAVLHGLLLARRTAAAPPCRIAWSDDGRTMRRIDAEGIRPLRNVVVDARWPLVRLQADGADGRRVRLVWWPDTLTGDDRRRLARFVRSGTDTDNSLPSMAA